MQGWRFADDPASSALLSRAFGLDLPVEEKLVWVAAAAEKTLNIAVLSTMSGLSAIRVQAILEATIETVGVAHLAVERT